MIQELSNVACQAIVSAKYANGYLCGLFVISITANMKW